MNKKILLVGGGGHCHSVLDSLCSCGIYDCIGVVAKNKENYRELQEDSTIAEYLVGIDEDLPMLFSDSWTDAFITLGSIGNSSGRKKIYTLLKRIGFRIPVIIDPSAVVSARAKIGAGTYIAKRTVVNSGSLIGECAIVNTGAIVEHDCCIGNFVHISPGAVLCGQVIVGDDSHIGAGSVVRQGIIIGTRVLIGAGSTVVKNFSNDAKGYGNPCRVVE